MKKTTSFFFFSLLPCCSRAKLLLRKKRFQEGLLEKTDGQLDNLERLVHDLEFAQVEKQVGKTDGQTDAARRERKRRELKMIKSFISRSKSSSVIVVVEICF